MDKSRANPKCDQPSARSEGPDGEPGRAEKAQCSGRSAQKHHEKSYIAIDLKSFYASVECVERGLDPLRTHLVVADASRTEKTICLAVTPSLKAYGIAGRARLFEVVQTVRHVNEARRKAAPGHVFTGKSADAVTLQGNPALALDYWVAAPRMAHYMKYSTRIYEIYLRFVAKQDIHVYSIDEVFIDATKYLTTYGVTAKELALRMVKAVLAETGITATAGIGTNLFLAKIAMDVQAKHMMADADGVRIAELDEKSFRQSLWDHQPITDFWRVGRGRAERLRKLGVQTMGELARLSLQHPERLFETFGIVAETLIDHAWGFESVDIADIQNYTSDTHSVLSSQVLQEPYETSKARLVAWEMADQLALDLFAQGLVADRVGLAIGYDVENLTNPKRRALYHGKIEEDAYGRRVPKTVHGTEELGGFCALSTRFCEAAERLFDRIVAPGLLVRRVTVQADHVVPLKDTPERTLPQQGELFVDVAQQDGELERREQAVQSLILSIRDRFGKNAIFKGINLEKGATARRRNTQIGGHQA